MYPQSELIRLAAYKLALRRDIALHRAQCVAAAHRLAQPLAWIDRALALVRRLSPLMQIAAVPLGFFAQRTVFRRQKMLGALFRWGPVVLGAIRGIGSAVETRARAQPMANGRH